MTTQNRRRQSINGKMGRNWKTIAAAVVVAATVFSLPAQAARDGWPNRITVGGGPLEGTIQFLSLGWSSLMNKKLELNASVESTAGASVNARLLSQGQQDFATGILSGIAIHAHAGTGFAKGNKYLSLNLMFPLETLPAQFWTPKDSGIAKIEDIAGKRLNLSRPGSGVDLFGKAMLEATGLSPSQITNVGHGQANQMMQDGVLNVASTLGSPPHPAIAAQTSKLDYLVFGMGHGDLAMKTIKVMPWFSPATIQGGIYKGNDQPIPTIGQLHWFGVGAHVPEDLVYEATKATFENRAELEASHRAWKKMSLDNVQHAKIPIHPGALRYYKEKGVKLP
jgi:uncharacterized protein